MQTDAGATGFVWFDDGIVWTNADAAAVDLDAGEATMGIGDDGQWVYSPFADGKDAIWANGVELVRGGEPAPGLPGRFLTFSSRPQMNDDGVATWVSGLADAPNGSTVGRALYADLVPLIASGDIVGGYPVEGQGVGFPYDFSGDGGHWIARCRVTVNGSSTQALVRNGEIVAQAGVAMGAGESLAPPANYQNFEECAINAFGDWAAIGDSDAAAGVDGFLVMNGEIVASEGGQVEGVPLTGNPLAVAIDDESRVVVAWAGGGGTDLLIMFLPPPVPKGPWLPVILLRSGDQVDTDGDGAGDLPIEELTANPSISPGLRLRGRCSMHVGARIDVGGKLEAAIIEVGLPAVAQPADLDGDGDIDGGDLGILLGTWLQHGIGDINCDGITDQKDLGLLAAKWGAGEGSGPGPNGG